MIENSCPGGVSSNKTGYYISYGNHLLKLDEDGNPLSGAKFEYSSMNEDVSYSFRQEEDFDAYYIPSQNKKVGEEDALKWLPKNIQDVYNSISSWEDLSIYFPKAELKGKRDNTFIDFGYNDCVNSSGYTENLSIMIPVKLKEVKSPVGYQKTDMISFARATLLFNFDENDLLTSKHIAIEFNPEMPLFELDSDVSYMDYVTNYSSIADFLYDHYDVSSTGCDMVREKATSYDLEKSSMDYCIGTPVVYDEEGDVSLSIDTTAEEKHEVSILEDSKIEARVYLKNNGNASSGDNIILTKIPDTVYIDSRTISDGGVFDKNARTITWNLEYMDPYSEKEFTFDIIGESSGTYIFKSSVESELSSLVTSPELKVNVLNNPKTGGFSLLFFIITIFSILLFYTRKKVRKS